MSYSNGQIPKSSLYSIPGGYLEKDAAIAWRAMRSYIAQKTGLYIKPGGPISSYRSLAEQRHMWSLYQSGKGNVAAVPGTSNHGWGKAVDEPVYSHQQAILKYGPKFGWSHAEGARVGEPWHFTYTGGYKPPKDPLTPEERKWVNEYARLKKANKDRKRRVELRRVIRQHRVAVYKKAKKHGWTKNLKLRYRILNKYS